MVAFIPYIRLIAAWLLQVFCFQYLVLGNGGYFPAFHLYGLLLLPIALSPLAVLLISALVGFTLDLTTMGGGLYTSSALMMGLSIPAVNRLFSPREGYEVNDIGTLKSFGFQWFTSRTILLLFIHHLWMFSMEAGRWGLMLEGWGKALTSALFGWGLFLAAQWLTQSNKRSR